MTVVEPLSTIIRPSLTGSTASPSKERRTVYCPSSRDVCAVPVSSVTIVMTVLSLWMSMRTPASGDSLVWPSSPMAASFIDSCTVPAAGCSNITRVRLASLTCTLTPCAVCDTTSVSRPVVVRIAS